MTTITLQTPKEIRDEQGNHLLLVSKDEYEELLKIAQLYEELEDLEDLQAIEEAKGAPTEPAEVFFERVEAYRKANGIN